MNSRKFIVLFAALLCVNGSTIQRNKAPKQIKSDNYTDKVLIEYDGTVEEAKEFGENNNLQFLRHVVRNFYEFRVIGAKRRSPSPVELDVKKMKGGYKKLKSVEQEKVNFMQRKSGLRERKFRNGTEVSHQRSRRAITVNDAQWSNQWHLLTSQNPSMGVKDAWDKGFSGSGITMAIVDDGIDTSHSDLNYDASLSYDFVYNVADPNHVGANDGHGTNCAGVAAALKNSKCVIGTAYEANIAGIRLLDDSIGATHSDEAAALTYKLSDIDIYSNSWGPKDEGTKVVPLPSVVNAAFEEGVENGRAGKGAIYVWASGNGGENDDDCQADGYTISMYTIGIAAVSKSGTPTFYSEHCSAVMAAAYSGNNPDDPDITTTGPSDTCVNDFSGTSSAVPLAAGIIALTLQANNALTWRDVQHLIAETSVSAGLTADFYSNGVGKKVSPKFGFGLMNADNMVDTAPTWKTVPPRISCYVFSKNYKTNANGITLTDNVDLSKCQVLYTEHVTLKVTFRSTYRGDTKIKLQSPTGTDVTVLGYRTNDEDSLEISWSLMTVHLWGESAAGSWRIKFEHEWFNNIRLSNWELTVYGTVTDPLAGTPSAGSLGGACTASGTCSGYTDAGCLEPGLVCIICSNGYRTVKGYCREDGTEGGFCSESVPCKSITGGLECQSNVCASSESSSDMIDLIVRIVIGTVVGAVGLVVCVIGIIVFCKILGKKKKVKPTSNNAAANDAVYANSGYIHTADQSASNNGAGNVDTSTAGGNVNTLTAEGNVNTSTAGGNVTTSTAEGNASTSTVGVTPPAGHSFGTTYHLPPITSNARNSS